MVHVRRLGAQRSSVLERPYTGHPFHEPALPFRHPERAAGCLGLMRAGKSYLFPCHVVLRMLISICTMIDR